MDPPTKLHALDSSGSLFLVFGLHTAFNYHTSLGRYTTHHITSSALRIPDNTYEDETQNRTCLPLKLQSMDPQPKLHAPDGSGSFFDCMLLSSTNCLGSLCNVHSMTIAQSSSEST